MKYTKKREELIKEAEKHTNLDNELWTVKQPKKDWGQVFAIGLGIVFIGYLLAHLIVAVTFANIAHAQVEVSVSIPCNNANYTYSPACKPVDFWQTTDGFEGVLANGQTFTQTRITPTLQLFQSGELCWLTNGYTTV